MDNDPKEQEKRYWHTDTYYSYKHIYPDLSLSSVLSLVNDSRYQVKQVCCIFFHCNPTSHPNIISQD